MKKTPSEGTDRIRILLVDDKPLGNLTRPPELPAKYAPWFDFRWLATPEECREFRDLSWLIAQNDPSKMSTAGWVPEILAIDYRLMEERQTVEERTANGRSQCGGGKDVSPLPALRAAASEWSEAIVSGTIPQRRGNIPEYWGCFSGGLILATFADHPCARLRLLRGTLPARQRHHPTRSTLNG